jgi:glucokinase
MELLVYLQKIYGSVSYERVVSGMGLVNIYKFLKDTGRGADPDDLTAEILHGDGGACISKAALAGKSELCDKTLSMFIAIYGAEAGNLALKVMATAGMYVGGGIAPKILERLKLPLFFETFCAKGRMEKILRPIPVRVILNDKTALLGAAEYAYMHLSSGSQSERDTITAGSSKVI